MRKTYESRLFPDRRDCHPVVAGVLEMAARNP